MSTTEQAMTVAQEDREAVATIVRRAMQDEFLSGSEWAGSIGRVAGRSARANVYAHEIIETLVPRLASVSSASAELVTASPVDDDYARAFIAGWNATRDHSDFDIALHYWMLSSVSIAASPEPVPATNQAGEVAGRFWLIVHEPGKLPDRKGSWPRSQLPQIMREFIAARPNAYLTVLTVGADGSPDVQHGPEALQMADGRSMRTGSGHNARTLAAHTEALATVAAANDEAFARGVEAAASFADQWSEPGAKVLSSISGLTDAEHEIARRTAEGIAASARGLLSQAEKA